MNTIKLAAILFLFIGLSYSTAQEWQTLTIGNGIKPTIAVDQSGNPHIAFMTEALNGFVKHAVKEQASFTVSEVENGYFYGPLDITIDNTGRPRIVYHDHLTEDLTHAWKSGSDWFIDRVMSTGHDGWDGSIVVDRLNISHVASTDPGNGIEYATQLDTSWLIETPGSGPVMYGFSTTIALDEQDNPHIGFYQSSNDLLQYAYKQDSTWQIETITENGRFPSMILGQNDTVKIAFISPIFGSLANVIIATRQDTGWSFVTIDTLFELDLNAAPRHLVDYKYHNAIEYLAYSDEKYIYFAQKLPHIWKIDEALSLLREPNITLGQQVSLELDANNNPHITYFEVSSNQEGGIVKYTTKEVNPSLGFNCPVNKTFDCVADTSVALLGSPIITNNPGTTTSIEYEDVVTMATCLSENDMVIRNWTITNDLNQIGTCTQEIRTRYDNFNDVVLPEDKILSGICFEDLENFDLGTFDGFCNGLTSEFSDNILSSNCNLNITIDRIWEIKDNCENVVLTYTQKIIIDFPPSIDIHNARITPDDGSKSGSISFDVNCGVPPYRYVWSNGSNDSSLVNLEGGMYGVTLLDGIQCLDVMEFEVPSLGTINFLSGQIKNVNGEDLEGVEISFNFLQDSFALVACDNPGSAFDFCILDTTVISGPVELCLVKEDNATTGVSAIDIVKAQRIILGLVNPCLFNLVAGDVNNSGTLTAADLVLMQRVILGFQDNFPVSHNWVFYRNDQPSDCQNFAPENLPATNLDFIGIKYGDLACNDGEININEIEIRNQDPLRMTLADKSFLKGEIFEAQLEIFTDYEIVGLQAALLINDGLELVEITSMVNEENFGSNHSDHEVKFLFYNVDGLPASKSTTLLQLRLKALNDGNLSSAIQINPLFNSIAYDDLDRPINVELSFSSWEFNPNTELRIYPNPFSDQIELHLPPHLLPLEQSSKAVEIFDIQGRKLEFTILQLSHNQYILNFSNSAGINPGVYILQIRAQNNTHVQTLIKAE